MRFVKVEGGIDFLWVSKIQNCTVLPVIIPTQHEGRKCLRSLMRQAPFHLLRLCFERAGALQHALDLHNEIQLWSACFCQSRFLSLSASCCFSQCFHSPMWAGRRRKNLQFYMRITYHYCCLLLLLSCYLLTLFCLISLLRCLSEATPATQ
jgi:hypothetical protein